MKRLSAILLLTAALIAACGPGSSSPSSPADSAPAASEQPPLSSETPSEEVSAQPSLEPSAS